jgi:hypothetical protein
MACRLTESAIKEAIKKLESGGECKIAEVPNSPFYVTNELLKFYSDRLRLFFTKKITSEGKDFFVYQQLKTTW